VLFRSHENADIAKDQKETNELFDSILLTLPRQAASGGRSANEVIAELAQDVLSKVPLPFNHEDVLERFPVLYSESMNTVLAQEVVRFNTLVKVLRESLTNVQKAIKGTAGGPGWLPGLFFFCTSTAVDWRAFALVCAGLVLMSGQLEEVFRSMLVGKVPDLWASVSYPSLKPLGSYINDLVQVWKARCWFLGGGRCGCLRDGDRGGMCLCA
jgi:dynein heavy chain